MKSIGGGIIKERFHRVKKIEARGENISNGIWKFDNTNPFDRFVTVRCPGGIKKRNRYFGLHGAGKKWQAGLPKWVEIEENGELLQRIEYAWEKAKISKARYNIAEALSTKADEAVFAPLLRSREIWRDGQTYTTLNEYDEYGNKTRVVEEGSLRREKQIDYWYHLDKYIVNRPASETIKSADLPGEFTTTYEYDDNGNLLTRNRFGVPTYFTYDANGNLACETDANGNKTEYEWEYGRQRRIKTPESETARTINEDGTIKDETDGNGHTTSFEYDLLRRTTAIFPPIGHPTHITYSEDNRLRTEKRGEYTVLTYFDELGRTVKTQERGIEESMVYGAHGRIIKMISSVGDTAEFDYLGRMIASVHQDDNRITFTFSESETIITDESGYETRFTYGAFGHPNDRLLLSIKDALGTVTQYNYNCPGSLIEIRQGSVIRSFVYDGRNFLTSESHPEKGTITYERDAVGNMKAKTDGLGTTNYFYDGVNRLEKIRYDGGSIDFEYDGAGNRKAASSPSHSATFHYDEANRLKRKDELISGNTYTTEYGYDGNGNVSKITYPSGRIVEYSYNDYDQVMEIKGEGWSVNDVTYFEQGTHADRIKHLAYSNGIATDFTYTPRNLLKTHRAGDVLDLEHACDKRGNLISLLDRSDNSRSKAFTYDELNRLKGFEGAWGAGLFEYDALGNRKIKKVGSSSPTDYHYTNNRLVETTGHEPATFDYNEHGDMTYIKSARGEYDLHYDQLHRLGSYNVHNGGPILACAYDGDGMRVSKTASGKTVFYHHDQWRRVISERDGAETYVDYVYLRGKLVAKLTNESIHFFHTDTVGTPLVITDAAGKIAWRADYLPFGEVYEATPDFDNRIMFVGKEMDDETGLYYFGARYMEAKIGRFVSPDPIGPVVSQIENTNETFLGNPQRLNCYVYASSSPYKNIDPDGLIWVTVDYDYFAHAISNLFMGLIMSFAEFIGTGERKVPFSNPREYVGQQRDIVQEWKSDSENPHRDSKYPIGTQRVITQTYREIWTRPGENLSGKRIIFVWDPIVPNRTYRDFQNTKYVYPVTPWNYPVQIETLQGEDFVGEVYYP
jgi:RHS repeat-associated protein